MMFLYLKKSIVNMKIIIIGVIIIVIAIAIGAYATMNESETSSEGTIIRTNESGQFYEEELSPEGNDYFLTLEETVGMEIVP